MDESTSLRTQWDDGYPVGGNYWGAPKPLTEHPFANVNFADNCNGPLQENCNGPDGISDIANCIATDICDQYPLMNPYSPAPDVVPPAWTSGYDLNVSGFTSSSVLVT